MKKLRMREEVCEVIYRPEDVDRIVQVCADRGYEISQSLAVTVWDKYSNSMCAGWMSLGTDDEVWHVIERYTEVEDADQD